MDEESIIEEQSNEMEVLGSMYEREMIGNNDYVIIYNNKLINTLLIYLIILYLIY